MLRAALAYARVGWRVHPLRPRGKKPLLSGWQHKATTDEATIREWWRDNPDANIGIATGPDSGIFVLDVDGADGERALVELEARHGPLSDMAPAQWTGNGWQMVLAWPEGRDIRNSAGRLGQSLDTRGEGGFAVAAPSIHPSGSTYAWMDDRSPRDLPPEPAPQWLVDLLDPPQAAQEPRGEWSRQTQPVSGDRRALRALEAELALVAVAPGGQRNNTLNRAAHALFRFVADNKLSSAVVTHGLRDAAGHAGLPPKEIDATIRSAATARGVTSG